MAGTMQSLYNGMETKRHLPEAVLELGSWRRRRVAILAVKWTEPNVSCRTLGTPRILRGEPAFSQIVAMCGPFVCRRTLEGRRQFNSHLTRVGPSCRYGTVRPFLIIRHPSQRMSQCHIAQRRPSGARHDRDTSKCPSSSTRRRSCR